MAKGPFPSSRNDFFFLCPEEPPSSIGMSQGQISLDAARSLARYLREHPDALSRRPGDLAEEFGLPETFVRDVLGGLDDPPDPERDPFAHVVSPIKSFGEWCVRAWKRTTDDPIKFVGVTTALALGIFLFSQWLLRHRVGDLLSAQTSAIGFLSLQITGLLFIVLVVVTLVAHMGVYFRHGMGRYALQGGVVAWMISAPTVMVFSWFGLSSPTPVRSLAGQFGLAGVLFFLCACYAGLGVVASIAGGVVKLARQERRQRRQTRQDLLARLFELQEQMERAGDEAVGSRWWEIWSERFRARPWLYVSVIGLTVGLLRVLTLGLAFTDVPDEQLRSSPLFWLTVFVLGLLMVLATAVPGLLSRSLGWALFNTWLLQGCIYVTYLLPVPRFGWSYLVDRLSSWWLPNVLALGALVAVLAYNGQKLEAKAALDRRLRKREPSALLAEMLRIQMRLTVQTDEICVLAVDVARSAEMKALAGPLEVEYSFREYQNFIRQTSETYGGQVYSTAGDGTIVEFQHAADAFHAAQAMQRDIGEFNRRRSRLPSPFRIRIGLHRGPVVADLDEVEFTEVIDVAAHCQAVAPVGGIALTQPVKEQLDETVGLLPLKDEVDGYPVYIALDPTGTA